MSTVDILGNLTAVRQQITAAAEAAGRDPHTVRLVAVCKTVGPEAVRQALAAGQCDFGENQVQPLVHKAAQLPPECTWHLIGHLQGNKVRPAVTTAACLHAVDSVDLLERIDRIAATEQRCPTVLLQVNISGEPTKSGVIPADAAGLLHCARHCEHLTCRGLMTMAPFEASETELGQVFGGLRRLRDRLQDESGVSLPELSMGMSGDFRIAIREGATLVRIGTAIFGPRALNSAVRALC
jgi:pyridoxal phosphate enzyme (YggS family)